MGTRTGNPPWQNKPSTLSPIDAVALTNIEDELDASATIDSPEFTGMPTAPTPPDGNISHRLATTEYVANAFAAFTFVFTETDTHAYQLTDQSHAYGGKSIALGWASYAYEYQAAAIGQSATAFATYSLAAGGGAAAYAVGATALGAGTVAEGSYSTAVGAAHANGAEAVGIGFNAGAAPAKSIAIGNNKPIGQREHGILAIRDLHIQRPASHPDPFGDYTATGEQTSLILHDTAGAAWRITVSPAGVIAATAWTEPAKIPWSERTTSTSQTWRAIACSTDGAIVAAAGQGVQLRTSTDSGATWTVRTATGNRQWYDMVMSGDGQKILAVASGPTYIARSVDGGATWTAPALPGPGPFYYLAATADLSQVYAADGGTGILYKSTDAGNTWAAVTAVTQPVSTVSVAPDGSALYIGVAMVPGGDPGSFGVLVSTDGGATIATTLQWGYDNGDFPADGPRDLVACNGDVAYLVTAGGIWKTSSAGDGWFAMASAPGGYNTALDADDTGTKLVATTAAGGIYVSLDSGTNWTYVNASALKTTYIWGWGAPAVSPNGARAYAGPQGGYVYTVALP